MDYKAKINLNRIALNDEAIFDDYIEYLKKVLQKVTTPHYELMQAKCVAVAYIENHELQKNLYGRLRDIALYYYRENFL